MRLTARYIILAAVCLAVGGGVFFGMRAVFSPTLEASPLFMRAREAEANGDYKAALAAYDMLAARRDNDGMVFYRRGLVNEALGNFAAAAKDMDVCISLGYPYAAALVKKGFIEGRNFNRRQQQVSLAGAAAALEPLNAQAFYCRAEGYFYLDNLPEAEADIKTALSLEPDDPDAAILQAAVMLRGGRKAEAGSALELLSRKYPANKEVAAALKEYYALGGKPPLANAATDADGRRLP